LIRDEIRMTKRRLQLKKETEILQSKLTEIKDKVKDNFARLIRN